MTFWQWTGEWGKQGDEYLFEEETDQLCQETEQRDGGGSSQVNVSKFGNINKVDLLSQDVEASKSGGGNEWELSSVFLLHDIILEKKGRLWKGKKEEREECTFVVYGE